jgi:hypothetical protein
MRYLKPFNEGLKQKEVIALRTFCTDCLIYIIEQGYELWVYQAARDPKEETFVYFCKPVHNDLGFFRWNDIKDHYIPFIQRLSKRYILETITFKEENQHKLYTLDEIINDNVDNNMYIGDITIKIRNETSKEI